MLYCSQVKEIGVLLLSGEGNMCCTVFSRNKQDSKLLWTVDFGIKPFLTTFRKKR